MAFKPCFACASSNTLAGHSPGWLHSFGRHGRPARSILIFQQQSASPLFCSCVSHKPFTKPRLILHKCWPPLSHSDICPQHEQKHLLHNRSNCRYRNRAQIAWPVLGVGPAGAIATANIFAARPESACFSYFYRHAEGRSRPHDCCALEVAVIEYL
jgi:hypothetical protein